jgi:hypothetical protein
MRTFLLLVLVACSAKKLEWKPQVLTKIDMTPFMFDIPKGWRDISESATPEVAAVHLTGGSHAIVREDAVNTDATISFLWANAPRSATCMQIVDAMAAQSSAIKIDTTSEVAVPFGKDDGCTYQFKTDDIIGTAWLRLQGMRFFMIQCLHPEKGDADADATCKHLIDVLQKQ